MMSDYVLEQAEALEVERISYLEWSNAQEDKTEEAREDIDRHYERESRIVESQLHNQYA